MAYPWLYTLFLKPPTFQSLKPVYLLITLRSIHFFPTSAPLVHDLYSKYCHNLWTSLFFIFYSPSLCTIFLFSLAKILSLRHASVHVIPLHHPKPFCVHSPVLWSNWNTHMTSSSIMLSLKPQYSPCSLSASAHIHTAPVPHCWILFSSSNTPDLSAVTTGLPTC